MADVVSLGAEWVFDPEVPVHIKTMKCMPGMNPLAYNGAHIAYDSVKRVLATTIPWNDTNEVIAVWSVPEAVTRSEVGTGPYESYFDSGSLLFTLKAHSKKSECTKSPTYGSRDTYTWDVMAFSHVGDDGWFLLVPSDQESGLVVYNLSTRSSSVFKQTSSTSKALLPFAVAAHGDVIAMALSPKAGQTFGINGAYCSLVTAKINMDGIITVQQSLFGIDSCMHVRRLAFGSTGECLVAELLGEQYICGDDAESAGVEICNNLWKWSTSDWTVQHKWWWDNCVGSIHGIIAIGSYEVCAIVGDDAASFAVDQQTVTINRRLIDKRLRRIIYDPKCETNMVYCPGVGLIAATSYDAIHLMQSEDLQKMISMSDAKVAWMGAVCRGRTRLELKRTAAAASRKKARPT